MYILGHKWNTFDWLSAKGWNCYWNILCRLSRVNGLKYLNKNLVNRERLCLKTMTIYSTKKVYIVINWASPSVFHLLTMKIVETRITTLTTKISGIFRKSLLVVNFLQCLSPLRPYSDHCLNNTANHLKSLYAPDGGKWENQKDPTLSVSLHHIRFGRIGTNIKNRQGNVWSGHDTNYEYSMLLS